MIGALIILACAIGIAAITYWLISEGEKFLNDKDRK